MTTMTPAIRISGVPISRIKDFNTDRVINVMINLSQYLKRLVKEEYHLVSIIVVKMDALESAKLEGSGKSIEKYTNVLQDLNKKLDLVRFEIYNTTRSIDTNLHDRFKRHHEGELTEKRRGKDI